MMHPSPTEHTRLLNIVIALHIPNRDWASPLSDMGYTLLTIEETFNVGKTGRRKCNPDIISCNKGESLILLIECKGGVNPDRKQLETYLLVTPNDVSQLATVSRPGQLKAHIMYSTPNYKAFSGRLSALLETIREEGTVSSVPQDIDILEITPALIKAHGTDLVWGTDLLAGIGISDIKYPNWFYPFSKDDSFEWKLFHIIRSLLHIIARKTRINPGQQTVRKEEVVQDLFQAYSYINPRHRGEIRGEVESCFSKLLKESRVKGLIKRLGTGGNPLSITDIDKVTDALKKLAKEIEEGQSQTSVTDFIDVGDD